MSIGIVNNSPMLRGSFNDWDAFYEYMVSYGIHMLAALFLSALTVYHREMSCNRVFHDEVEEEESSSSLSSSSSSSKDYASSTGPSITSNYVAEETDQLLDHAAMYCSGKSILHLAARWVDCFPCDDKYGQEVVFPTKFLLDEQITPTDLLERAGNYCSGEPIRVALWALLSQTSQERETSPRRVSTSFGPSFDPFTNSLPSDAHVHIASYLHPKDILALSCVSKTYQKVVNDGETSHAIWNTLWLRDYAWVVQNWEVGNRAYRESLKGIPGGFVVDKAFYFTFGETYLAYVLAGHNTMSSCYVGLHGQVYDITSFLLKHPGSPDTLMVHSGKDATRYFEDMTHSFIARRMARKLCVISDLAQKGGDWWGLRPSEFTRLNESDMTITSKKDSEAGSSIMKGRKQANRGGTLYKTRQKLAKELQDLEHLIETRFENDPTILGGQVNPYYDPFRKEWRIWYTNMNLENVFASAPWG